MLRNLLLAMGLAQKTYEERLDEIEQDLIRTKLEFSDLRSGEKISESEQKHVNQFPKLFHSLTLLQSEIPSSELKLSGQASTLMGEAEDLQESIVLFAAEVYAKSRMISEILKNGWDLGQVSWDILMQPIGKLNDAYLINAAITVTAPFRSTTLVIMDNMNIKPTADFMRYNILAKHTVDKISIRVFPSSPTYAESSTTSPSFIEKSDSSPLTPKQDRLTEDAENQQKRGLGLK